MTPEIAAQVAAIQARHADSFRPHDAVPDCTCEGCVAWHDRAALLALLPAVWEAATEAAARVAEGEAQIANLAHDRRYKVAHQIAAAIRALPSPFADAP